MSKLMEKNGRSIIENTSVLRKLAGLDGGADLFKNLESQNFEVQK
jgi:hypothetical protein